MRLQVIKDGYGKNTRVFIPMNDWNVIVQKQLIGIIVTIQDAI
jgi:hypothetical protein